MDKLSELEAHDNQGIVVERMAAAAAGTHASLALETRFDVCGFAALVMLDAARRIASLPHGAPPYSLASDIARVPGSMTRPAATFHHPAPPSGYETVQARH